MSSVKYQVNEVILPSFLQLLSYRMWRHGKHTFTCSLLLQLRLFKLNETQQDLSHPVSDKHIDLAMTL